LSIVTFNLLFKLQIYSSIATGDQKPGMMISQVSLALNFCRLVGDSCNYHNSSAGAALCAPLEEIARNFYTV
jgi:hypothetical protein